MTDRNIRVYNPAAWRNDFMDSADPAVPGTVSDPPLPKIGKGRLARFVKGGVVFHHYHIRIRCQDLL